MTRIGEERRASERLTLGLACEYVIPDLAAQEGSKFHQGLGTVLNMSRGGMLLLLDVAPRLEQVIQVHLYHSRTDQTLSQVQVIWTSPAEEQHKYLAGCKFVSGPYSLSQDRICAPTEFL